MVKLIEGGIYCAKGVFVDDRYLIGNGFDAKAIENAYKGTISYRILSAHNDKEINDKNASLKIKFDALASHDITYVGIIQTAKASGLQKFPLPYVLTNCHNSLCAVGGTINEDDHMFGLSSAKKYGGIYVPPHQAVIHTFMRENMSGCGKMILGSDSHTRYGALGVMAIGEGGPELVKQLLCRTYDTKYPGVIAVQLNGKPQKGVGAQDVALAIIKAVFANGFVKNKVLEFIGDGIANLPIEFRNGIDVMTTETTCLSSIWATDNEVKKYYQTHGRQQSFEQLSPADIAYYDGAIIVQLDKITPQIALPFHPSNVYDLLDLIANPKDIFALVEKEANSKLSGGVKLSLLDKVGKDGKINVQQGIIAGCAGGTYDNIFEANQIMKGKFIGNDAFTMSVYPSSQPIYYDLARKGVIAELLRTGSVVKTAFCGPCFGAGDVPSNNSFSIRHTTRNFESREGSKPSGGQIASVALMDARSIAATAINGGVLTSATQIEYDNKIDAFEYDDSIYRNRVYYGWTNEDTTKELQYGPNIKDWPEVISLTDNIMIKLASVITDPVTTTDELIPSGETSSYRSNPLKLAEYTLSRKDPLYVGCAKAIYQDEIARREGAMPVEYDGAIKLSGLSLEGSISLGSGVYACKPGDGSAREQAASCQKVLGGVCNIAKEYATKRYRSNLINWGMLPLLCDASFEKGDIIIIPNIKNAVVGGAKEFSAKVVRGQLVIDITLKMDALTTDEQDIISCGCLMNYYKAKN